MVGIYHAAQPVKVHIHAKHSNNLALGVTHRLRISHHQRLAASLIKVRFGPVALACLNRVAVPLHLCVVMVLSAYLQCLQTAVSETVDIRLIPISL